MAVKGSLPTPQTAENMRADAINKKIFLKQQAGAVPNSAVQDKVSSLTGPVVFRNISPPANDDDRFTGRKRSFEPPERPPEGLSAILRKILHDPQKIRDVDNGGLGIARMSSNTASPSPPLMTNNSTKPELSSLPISEIHEVLTDILGSSERLQDLLDGFENQFSGVQDVQRAIQGLFLALRGFIDNNRPSNTNASSSASSGYKKMKSEHEKHSSQHNGSNSSCLLQGQGERGERLIFELNHQVDTTSRSHFNEENEEEEDEDEGSGEMIMDVVDNGNGSQSNVNAFDED